MKYHAVQETIVSLTQSDINLEKADWVGNSLTNKEVGSGLVMSEIGNIDLFHKKDIIL